MKKWGPYMNDVIGKCRREILAVRTGEKPAIHRYLSASATYAAAKKQRNLKKEFARDREELGFLVYTEDIKTGKKAHFPVAVDVAAGIVRQLNAEEYGLLIDVEECLHKKTPSGDYVPWHTAKKQKSVWAPPSQAEIHATSSAHSTYGSTAGEGRRVGQNAFRKALFDLWGKKCALCGCSSEEILRASHILRWEAGTTDQRNDPHNGIPLAAHIDAAFENGLISFSDDGGILISKRFQKEDRAMLGIHEKMRLPFVPERTPTYLAWHRKDHGFE